MIDPVMLAITVALILLLLSLVVLVRGRLWRAYLASRWWGAALMAVGFALLFWASAPPVAARAGSFAGAEEFPTPPPAAREYRRLAETVQPPRREDVVFPEQRSAFETWEKKVFKAYGQADAVLRQVQARYRQGVDGDIDRFTAWVWMARLGQDLKQADLTLYDTTPPSALDLEHQKRLQRAVSALHRSLDHKRESLRRVQAFLRDLDPKHLEEMHSQLARGTDTMRDGLKEIAAVRLELGVSAPPPGSDL